MLIKEILKSRYRDLNVRIRSGRYYGIEIETEGADLPYHVGDQWKAVEDGSLRHNPMALEYVSKNPVPYSKREAHLQEFKEFTSGATFTLSHRCSVHVHRNVMHLPIERVFKVVALYMMFEPALSSWCGEARKGNRFCLRGIDSYVLIDWIGKIFHSNITNARPDNFKYSSINVSTIPRLGTLEFRALEGTTDTERILKWIEIIECLFKYSVKTERIEDVVEGFYADPKGTVKNIFGKYSEELFPEESVYHECEYSISINISMIYWDGKIMEKYAIVEEGEKDTSKKKPNELEDLMRGLIDERNRNAQAAIAIEGVVWENV